MPVILVLIVEVLVKEGAMEEKISKELYNIMDALAALRCDLKCEPNIPGETLVLSASASRDACDALESASTSIKRLAVELGGEIRPVQPNQIN